MQSGTRLNQWSHLLQPKGNNHALNSKYSYILSLSPQIEAFRLHEEKFKYLRIQHIILKYTGELVPTASENKIYQQKIKTTKVKLNNLLAQYNKRCKLHETQTH